MIEFWKSEFYAGTIGKSPETLCELKDFLQVGKFRPAIRLCRLSEFRVKLR